MATQESFLNLSYDSKNTRINQLIDQVFRDVSQDDIKVGLIDPILGYVVEVSICEANDYAKDNPGTAFIFRDANNSIQYLNINEVNALTPEVLVSSASTCSGIQTRKKCGESPPRIQFFGGGGVGAQANAIVGVDGALLAIDLIAGGFGYQYPPIVRAIDDCQYGSGATLSSELGELSETFVTFEDENDFEDYEICPDTTVGYGRNWGPNGEDLGPWEPETYTNVGKDPIREEIDAYQKSLLKKSNPFWTTKSTPPKSITAAGKKYNIPYVVTDFRWSDFMNLYAISPVPPSNVSGTDEAGKLFVFDWDVDFPYDGEYTFRGLCDNVSKLYVDNIQLFDLGSFNDAVRPTKKELKAGPHNIRIDLLNLPILAAKPVAIPVTPASPIVLVDMLRYYTLDFSGEAGAKHFFTIDPANEIIDPNQLKLEGIAWKVFKESTNVAGTVPLYRLFKGGDHLYTISGGEKSSAILAGYAYEGIVGLVYSQPGPDRIEVFRFYDSPGPPGGPGPIPGEHFYTTSTNEIPTLPALGYVSEGVAFYAPTIAPTPLLPIAPSVTAAASAPSTIQNQNIFNTVDYISKANRTLWRTNPAASLTSGLLDRYGVCPFDTSSAEAQVESFAGIHTIIWNNINFPVTGDYRIQIAVDDNVSLYIGETLIRKEGFYAPGKRNPDLDQVYTFNQGNYTIRAELENIEVGPIAIRNPMVLAVNIETAFTTGEVVSAKSFNENPMGISVSIDAPPLPVPKEPAPIQTGRCPPSPIWSTRFPSSKEQWYPVRRTTGDPTKGTAWSKFMNRYAISPVPPFDIDETDSAGVNFINTWTVELPYPGFYGVRGTADNSGRVLIDGKEISKLDTFIVSNPRLEKVYLEKGTHQIEVEVFNTPTERAFDIPIKVFSTDDWIFQSSLSQQTGSVDVNFKITTGANFSTSIEIFDLFTVLKPFTPFGENQLNESLIRSVEIGKIYNVKFNSGFEGNGGIGVIKLKSIGNSGVGMEDLIDNDYDDLVCVADNGKFFDFVGNTCKFTVTGTTTTTGGLTSGTSKSGVTYEGPTLTSYIPGLISPVFQNVLTPTEEIQGKTFIMTWRNVDFPEDGKYNLTALADDLVIVRVDGVEVGRAKVFEDRRTFLFNSTKGKKSVQLELSNIRIPNTGFKENPVVTFVEIIKNSSVSKVAPLPWTTNPIGVSAILIPPPCPKLVKGKGIISKVIVDDPGNGYACPPGLKLNPETGKCEPPPKECPPGQILDPKTGECINICPPGEVYDKVTKKCIKPPIDCPPGQVYDPVTQKCVNLPAIPCPTGQTRNPITGLCEPISPGTPPPGTPPPGTIPPGTIPPGTIPPGPIPPGTPTVTIIPRDPIIPLCGSTVVCWTVTNANRVVNSTPGNFAGDKLEGCTVVIAPCPGGPGPGGPGPGGPGPGGIGPGGIGPGGIGPGGPGPGGPGPGGPGPGGPGPGGIGPGPGGIGPGGIGPGGIGPGPGPGGIGPGPGGIGPGPGGIGPGGGGIGPGGGGIGPGGGGIGPGGGGIGPGGGGGTIEYCITVSGPGGTATACATILIGTPTEKPPQYPVCLILDEVLVENPGINYNCGVDKLQIVPDNGVILDYVCNSFGRISKVKILDNGTCFPEYPSITMISDTGVNASFRPVFRVVRDPIDPALTRENQKLIQVTDLVGLKKTGYIGGRPYYGAVFYENTIRYAGYYKTVGTLIRVYDTLQESITAEVTTAPSAIEKFGTDTNSNNPRLNIPGTPTNLI